MTAVERVIKLCEERGVAFHKLEKDLGFSNGYIRGLRRGIIPHERARQIANYFGVSVEYIQTGESSERVEGIPSYFYDAEACKFAEFLHENPDYKVLMDSVRKIPVSDVKYIKDLIDRINK